MKHHKQPFPLDIFNPHDRHDRDFLEYHEKNPTVYQTYKRLARTWRNAGHARGSSEQFIQILRWEHNINPCRVGSFKISNNNRKRYAILLSHEHPREFGSFFRFRKQR